jgi:hypothetical protein
MKKLRTKINRFFYKNSRRGIRNLMLYIAVGNLIVYLLCLLNSQNPLFYYLLIFDRSAILRGEVWRLISYPLTFLAGGSPFLGVIALLFYYWCGQILEQYWGTLRLNIYYFSGILLTDIAALLLRVNAGAGYINLSLFLAVATILPNEMVRIYFIIPVKMKWLGLVDLGVTLVQVILGVIAMVRTLEAGSFPYLAWLLPIIALLNYFLFFGKQIVNLLPDFLRFHPTHKSWKRAVKQGTIYNVPRAGDNARFRCTVCGRTELTNPKLEFRYCSKCKGYRCYCEDHINNHTHITE